MKKKEQERKEKEKTDAITAGETAIKTARDDKPGGKPAMTDDQIKTKVNEIKANTISTK